jgi:hypothetical protein
MSGWNSENQSAAFVSFGKNIFIFDNIYLSAENIKFKEVHDV